MKTSKISFSKYLLREISKGIPIRIDDKGPVKWPCVTDEKIREKSSLTIFNSFCQENFFWICVNSGNAMPWPSEVTNIKTLKKEENPRNQDQVEPKDQFFFVVDNNTFSCYISDNRKKRMIEEFLSNKMDREIKLQPIFKSPEEFCKEIKKLDTIEFASVDSLFHDNEDFFDMFSMNKDPFNMGKPAEFQAKLSFKGATVKSELALALHKYRGKASLKQLICIGRDENDIQKVLNLDSLSYKIDIEVEKDDTGLFSADSVVLAFESKIRCIV